MSGSNIDDQTIEGTDVDKNSTFGEIHGYRELPAPKKVVLVNPIDPATTVIEAPQSDGGMGLPDDTKVPKIKLRDITEAGARGCPIKRYLHIDELDNGYILNVDAGSFHKRYVFGSIPKLLKAISVILRIDLEKRSEV